MMHPSTCFKMAIHLSILSRALIFILRLRFPAGKSIATISLHCQPRLKAIVHVHWSKFGICANLSPQVAVIFERAVSFRGRFELFFTIGLTTTRYERFSNKFAQFIRRHIALISGKVFRCDVRFVINERSFLLS